MSACTLVLGPSLHLLTSTHWSEEGHHLSCILLILLCVPVCLQMSVRNCFVRGSVVRYVLVSAKKVVCSCTSEKIA